MRKYAFKVFYDGTRYHGFQRQPNGLAVENYLEYAFISGGLISSFKEQQYINASRTDSGVSAVSNVFSVHCSSEPSTDVLNGYLPKDRSIFLHASASVPSDFSSRHNSSKIYEYHIPPGIKIYNLERIFQFQGYHDFSNFIKSGGAGEYNPYTSITSITIDTDDQWKIISIQGDSFGREQIRRMIGFLMEERLQNVTVTEMIKGKETPHLASAPPEYLLLRDVTYSPPLNWIDGEATKFIIRQAERNYGRSVYSTEFIHQAVNSLL